MIEQLKQRHISRQFNNELEQICSQLLAMGGLVEKQFIDAFEAIHRGDSQLAAKVKLRDNKVNQLDLTIDEACEQIIVKRQPIAGDLRLVLGIIKISPEIERLGNDANNIAQTAIDLNKLNQPDLSRRFDQLGQQVNEMLRKTFNAFARMDEQTAHQCSQLNNVLIESCQQVRKMLVQQLSFHSAQNDADRCPSLLSIIVVVDILKRAGTRCQAICDYICYAIKGKEDQ